jgi:Zn-dependent protease
MRSSFTLGRPFGIEVGAHWSLLAFAALGAWSLSGALELAHPGYASSTYWTTSAVIVGLFLAGVVVHELAHALVARRHGIEVERITLWILGGMAQLSKEPTTPKAELRIAAAGPLASFGVAAALFGAAAGFDALTDARVLIAGLRWLAIASLVLAVFNLLPARPMDGGRILTALLWARRADRSAATLAAAKVSAVLGWLLIGLGAALLLNTGLFAGVWFALIGWMVVSGATAEQRLEAWRARLAGVTFGEVMVAPPAPLPGWMPARDAAGVAARSPGTPVQLVADSSGLPSGMLTAADLLRAAMSRPDVSVGELARPLAAEVLVAPVDDVAAVLAERGLRLPMFVRDGDGRIVGQVRLDDLARWSRAPRAGRGTRTAWPPPRAEDRVPA